MNRVFSSAVALAVGLGAFGSRAAVAQSPTLPKDSAKVLYEYAYDSQEKVDAHWKSAGGALPPQVVTEKNATFLRWGINDKSEFGRLASDKIEIPQTGIVDVDVLMRIPQSWLDLGKLPDGNVADKNAEHMTFKTMKLFRLFPAKGGHNATIYGVIGTPKKQGYVYLRDFKVVRGTKTKEETTVVIVPDQWVAYRIRYDYEAQTVGFWIGKDGKFVEVGTVPGGGEKTMHVGPIFHASTRDERHGYGKHKPTYVDYHSYRVLHREAPKTATASN